MFLVRSLDFKDKQRPRGVVNEWAYRDTFDRRVRSQKTQTVIDEHREANQNKLSGPQQGHFLTSTPNNRPNTTTQMLGDVGNGIQERLAVETDTRYAA